jgi:glucose/arabinose dehydrogenase
MTAERLTMSRLQIVALPLLLIACGESGGGGTPPPATNRAPVFSSPASTTVAENTATAFYTTTATDPDGNALTYSITGGGDAAQFRITSTGALSFAVAPDFENPADADGNNSYDVQIAANDGTASTTLALTVSVSNAGSDNFRVRRVTTGFTQPLFLTGIPDGTGRAFVVQKGGQIRILSPASGAIAATPFLDVSGQISTDGERGLLGLALAPDFATSGTFYIYLTNPAGNIEVRRYGLSPGNGDVANAASGDVILVVPHPGFSNHNGGWIDFGNDGFLYVATGDGGGAGDPAGNAQNPNATLGKILRIDPSGDGFPGDPSRDYRIPAGNPFATTGGAPEVWALGLRNPFRNAFDRTTGNLFMADVGQGAVEEIDLIPSGVAGLNFGWNRREGTQPYNGGANSGAFTPPVAEYLHGSGPTQGNSITGGIVYRGPVEALQAQYFFADFVSANIWSIPVARLVQAQTFAASRFTQRRSSFAPNAGTIDQIASFGTDQTGNLYIVGLDGEVYIVEPA